jgi:hypothetical protein
LIGRENNITSASLATSVTFLFIRAFPGLPIACMYFFRSELPVQVVVHFAIRGLLLIFAP